MNKSQFSEEQKIGILRQVRAGITVKAVYAAHNIGVQTYYGWKRKYGTMGVSKARRLRALEEERARVAPSGGGPLGAKSDPQGSERKKNGKPVGRTAGGAAGQGIYFLRAIHGILPIDGSHERLQDTVRSNIFEAATGRKRGDEDVNAHLRKGIVGDWRNQLTILFLKFCFYSFGEMDAAIFSKRGSPRNGSQ